MIYNVETIKMPFTLNGNTVVYIEGEYNENVNRYIMHNYHRLKDIFNQYGLEFIYLPKYWEESRGEDELHIPEGLGSSFITESIDHDKMEQKIVPSLLFISGEKGEGIKYKAITLPLAYFVLHHSLMPRTRIFRKQIFKILKDRK